MSGRKNDQQVYTLELSGFDDFYEKNKNEYGIEFFKAVSESNQIALNDEELAFILNTLEHYQNHSFFHELWKMIEKHPVTYKLVVEFINQNRDYTDLIKLYLDKKFNFSSVEDILNEINKLLEASPYLLKNRCFRMLAIQKTATAVGDSSDIFKAANAVKVFTVTNPDLDFTKLKDRMMVYSEIALLEKLDLQNITLKDIDIFMGLTTGKLNQKDLKDKPIINKYKSMIVLYELFYTPGVSSALLLQECSPSIREELREVLKNVLRDNLSKEYFQHVLTAFDDDDGSYHFPQLFGYLSKNVDENLMLSFIKWTAKNLQLDHHYHRAMKAYLKSHPRSIWKNKTFRKELQQISSDSFRKLVKEVQNETSSPVVKFFKRRGISLSIGLLITLVAGGGLYFGYDLLTDSNEKVVASKSSTAAVVEKEGTNLEPFKRWEAEKAFVFTVNGQQQQMTYGQANPTGGKSLVLTDSQNIETSFDLVIDSEVTPFDDKGVLKEGMSLYHVEYDFDKNGASEIVIMALSQTFESFVWVYSPISENGSVGIRADLTIKGMSNAKLVDNTLTLLGENGQSETYAYDNQGFVKQ